MSIEMIKLTLQNCELKQQVLTLQSQLMQKEFDILETERKELNRLLQQKTSDSEEAVQEA